MTHRGQFKIVTLGCRTNQYEAQGYRDQLLAMGFIEALEGEVADLCIVNTCTVTESADQKSHAEVRRLFAKNPNAKVVVTGCAVERKGGLAHWGEATLVSNLEKEKLIQKIFPEAPSYPEFKINHFEAHTRAFVKVQDGCNSFCSYCIIPYVRGRSRSRAIPEIIEEIEGLVQNGYKEVVLTGINIGDFDGGAPKDGQKIRLHELMRAVDKIEGVERVRLSSIDPDEVDDELIDVILSGKKMAISLHLVLQAGSPAILKRMNRKYTIQQFQDTVLRLRAANPLFGLTTDLIVGFPGESEEDFLLSLKAIEETGFLKVHVFPYSEREGTRSARFLDKVPREVIDERKQRALRAAEKSSYHFRQKMVGAKAMLIVEECIDGMARGHTEHFVEVVCKADLPKGAFVQIQIIEILPDVAIGVLV